MRGLLIAGFAALVSVFVAGVSFASDYAGHDLHGILSFSDTAAGKKATVNMPYLDQILDDLSAHAGNYPAHFDNPAGRDRAVNDVKSLAGMLGILSNNPNPSPEILLHELR